jgi:hypothetical protein
MNHEAEIAKGVVNIYWRGQDGAFQTYAISS